MKLDLSELERLEKAADPAPWQAKIERENLLTTACHVYGEDPYMPGLIDVMYYRNPEANCELIAAMRNALPHLIKELRAAREIVETVRAAELFGFKRDLEKYDEAVK